MTGKSNLSEPPVTTDQLIRSLMVAQRRVESRNALPALVPASEEIRAPGKPDRQARRQTRESATWLAALRAWRPEPRHILWGALAMVMLLYPLLLPALLFLILASALIVYLTLGPDRLGEILANLWERLARRAPALADRLRQRVHRVATKLDALRARLPDHWAERLALPDFSGTASAVHGLDDKPDPFEKLKKLPDVYRG